MAAAIYFEARSEPLDAQVAVAGVVLERVAHDKYPDDVCGVVFQHKQFSAFNAGLPAIRNYAAWAVSENVAQMVLDDPQSIMPIVGATHYHTEDVMPYWAGQFEYLGQSGSHLFYRGF